MAAKAVGWERRAMGLFSSGSMVCNNDLPAERRLGCCEDTNLSAGGGYASMAAPAHMELIWDVIQIAQSKHKKMSCFFLQYGKSFSSVSI